MIITSYPKGGLLGGGGRYLVVVVCGGVVVGRNGGIGLLFFSPKHRIFEVKNLFLYEYI